MYLRLPRNGDSMSDLSRTVGFPALSVLDVLLFLFFAVLELFRTVPILRLVEAGLILLLYCLYVLPVDLALVRYEQSKLPVQRDRRTLLQDCIYRITRLAFTYFDHRIGRQSAHEESRMFTDTVNRRFLFTKSFNSVCQSTLRIIQFPAVI